MLKNVFDINVKIENFSPTCVTLWICKARYFKRMFHLKINFIPQYVVLKLCYSVQFLRRAFWLNYIMMI